MTFYEASADQRPVSEARTNASYSAVDFDSAIVRAKSLFGALWRNIAVTDIATGETRSATGSEVGA